MAKVKSKAQKVSGGLLALRKIDPSDLAQSTAYCSEAVLKAIKGLGEQTLNDLAKSPSNDGPKHLLEAFSCALLQVSKAVPQDGSKPSKELAKSFNWSNARPDPPYYLSHLLSTILHNGSS